MAALHCVCWGGRGPRFDGAFDEQAKGSGKDVLAHTTHDMSTCWYMQKRYGRAEDTEKSGGWAIPS